MSSNTSNRRRSKAETAASAARKPRKGSHSSRMTDDQWREHRSAYNSKYRAANRDRLLEYERRYRGAHRTNLRQYANDHYADSKRSTALSERISALMLDPQAYILQTLGVRLRPYQAEPFARILESIEGHLGDTIVLLFPRQSGKDELLTDLTLYLADLYSVLPVSIVHVNPTYRPQTEAALQRFDRAAQSNLLTRGQWHSAGGFVRQLGQLSVRFLSGDKHANVAGATASLLLIINEAQDILPDVYARNFEPMVASTNAPRVIVGTAMTSRTLLARQRLAALQAEKADGRKRVFTVDADTVAALVPWYGAHVAAAVEMHGRQHPMVKTQYFNEELDAQGGMFDARRRALMFAGAQGASAGGPGSAPICVFCIDVAGQDEMGSEARLAREGLGNPGRDATMLSIFTVDLSSLESLHGPTFSVVKREQWIGQNHATVSGQIIALAERWRPRHIVVDATGVGEGLTSILQLEFHERVIPVKFSAQKKSEMGYRFLSLIETGRFRDRTNPPGETHGSIPPAMVDEQYAACISEILPGPQKTMRWGVPDGTRNANGELIHDDIVIADALITEVDALEWRRPGRTLIVMPKDPLEEMSQFRE